MRRRSTIAFLMCLPLIVIIAGLVVYPAFYSIYLSMLNKAQTRFIGLGNFTLPAVARHVLDGGAADRRSSRCSAVFFKALIGLDHRASRQQSADQGPAQMARHAAGAVGHSAGAVDARLVVAVRSHPLRLQLDPQRAWASTEIPWLSDPYWARFSVILVNVWYGAPFFLIMYLAALKSVPEQLYEAAAIDGANAWQKFVHITLPMMRNIIAITVLFSLIVTFANFDIVQIMTGGRPAQHDARVRDLRLPARHPLRRPAARRRDLAVHVPDPGRSRRSSSCAACASAGGRSDERDRHRQCRTAKRFALRASLQRNRRWALITSYVFLIMFAIFFLMPPYYMIVTVAQERRRGGAHGDQSMDHRRRGHARSIQDPARRRPTS